MAEPRNDHSHPDITERLVRLEERLRAHEEAGSSRTNHLGEQITELRMGQQRTEDKLSEIDARLWKLGIGLAAASAGGSAGAQILQGLFGM